MEHTRISHYQVGRRLGRGGMGEVYEAVDLDLDRTVALKFVAPALASETDALQRFEREARAAAALNHPHIATVYAFEREGGRAFIAMELASGGSVRDRLHVARLPVFDALGIARDVAGALALAHRRGVVHRDVKPENLMFDEDHVVKLMDFGLARAAHSARITMSGSSVGTPAYMPPESVRGQAAAAGDVYALGVTLHEMISGELPFSGDNPMALMFSSANEPPRPLRAVRPEVPEAVESLVLRMLEKEPGRRPTAGAVARELATLTGAPVPAGAGDIEEMDTIRIPEAIRDPAGPRSGRTGTGSGAAGRVIRFGLLLGGATLLAALLLRPGRDRPGPAAVAHNNRGYELMQKDSLESARIELESALRAEPDYPEAMLNLALVLHRKGDMNGAAALYGRVARAHAEAPRLAASAHYGLAELDMGSGALTSAIEHYREALARDTTNVAYPNNLAFALIRAGRPNEAVSVLEPALARFPGAAQLHKNLGLARLRAGAIAEAAQAFDSALDRDPGLASAWGFRAEARARLGDLAGSRADWDTYLGMLHDETERPAIEAQLRRLGVL